MYFTALKSKFVLKITTDAVPMNTPPPYKSWSSWHTRGRVKAVD